MLGATPSIAARRLTSRMGSYIEAHPNIAIELTSIQGEVHFETTRLDVAALCGTGS